MDAHQARLEFEPAIWARLIQAPGMPISPDAARFLLSIEFSEADQERMQLLMDHSNEGTLSSAERAELDSYENIANVLSVMHSRARSALGGAPFDEMPRGRNC
jgi:hypothetical protein